MQGAHDRNEHFTRDLCVKLSKFIKSKRRALRKYELYELVDLFLV